MELEREIFNWSNGQIRSETTYLNRKEHGLTKWWRDDGSLRYLGKWHTDQCIWEIYFSSEEQIPSDAEVELFFHQMPELS